MNAPRHASPSTVQWGRRHATAPLVLALIVVSSGCVGSGHATELKLVDFHLTATADGLRITLTSPSAFPDQFEVTIGAVGSTNGTIREKYDESTLLRVSDAVFEVPRAYPFQGGMGFDVEALVDGKQVGGREFFIRDLGVDELPGLRERQVGAVYDLRFEKTSDNGNGSETQRGLEAVAIDPKGRPSRLFAGNGTLNKTLGPLHLSIEVSKIERTTVLGQLADEDKIGRGTWQAVAPAAGNGTVRAFRQDLAGYEHLTLHGGQARLFLKQVTSVVLDGAFTANGQTNVLDGSVFWTEWVDVETARVAWIRQRPQALETPGVEGFSEFSPTHDSGLHVQPWTLQALIPVPAHEGDEFAVAFGAGRQVVVEVSPETATRAMGRQMASRVWTSGTDDFTFSMQASADPALAGLPLIWELRHETPEATWSVSNVLVALKSNR